MTEVVSAIKYPVMEHFYTIQGEGFYSGHAAYFIRLGGCSVGCVWCDVKDSWEADKHPQIDVNQLVKDVLDSKTNICVITGGEPCMYDLNPLVNALKSNRIKVHLETSGAFPIQGDFDWVCLSPKKFKFPIQEALQKADEFKPVIYNKSDFAWAESFQNDLKSTCKKYVQPEWSKADEMLPLIIDYVKINPDWQISLQTHKFLNIP
jgi:7-carboxy-7-deazaguanine synthase